MPIKGALYLRVSTDKQNYENQKIQLLEYCKNKGIEIVAIYEEAEHGNYPESKRPQFLLMLDDAAKHKFDAIVVWALDRFTREGVAKTHHYITQLLGWKVSFISYQEPFLNTSQENEVVRDIMLTVMATLAKQERLKISERTKASLERAQKEIAEKGYYVTKAGKKVKTIGAQLSYSPEVLEQMRQLFMVRDAEGKPLTIYKISKLLGMNPGKIKYAKEHLLKAALEASVSSPPPAEAQAQSNNPPADTPEEARLEALAEETHREFLGGK